MIRIGTLVIQQPLWLLLIPVILGLYYFYSRKHKNFQRYISFPVLPTDIKPTIRVRLVKIIQWFPVVALLFMILAMTRPQRMFQEEKVEGEGIDIFLVMDLSSSMLARDFDPDRLEVSKRVGIEFVRRRLYDRIGLVVFAGESYTQCPLTQDHEVLISYMESLQCGFLEDGTAIGMGLAAAVNRLQNSHAKSKVVVLLTDGVNNAGYIQPQAATELAVALGVKVYTIGVGSYGEAQFPVRRTLEGDYIFGYTQVKIDEELLQQIADKTGGRYYRAASAKALEQIYSEIDSLEKTDVEIKRFRKYTEYFYIPLLFGLGLLFFFLILRSTWLRILPE